jgi:hypothetical protein
MTKTRGSVYTWLLLQLHQSIRGSCCSYTNLYVAPAAATPIYTWLLLQLLYTCLYVALAATTFVYTRLLPQLHQSKVAPAALHLSICGSCFNYISLYVALASTTSVYTWLLLQLHQSIRCSCFSYTSLYVHGSCYNHLL